MPLLNSDNGKKSERKQLLRAFGLIFNIGWYVALSLVIPTAVGLWLDDPERFNTRPLFTLIGFGLGTMVAGYGLYRMLRQYINEQKDIDRQKNSNEGA